MTGSWMHEISRAHFTRAPAAANYCARAVARDVARPPAAPEIPQQP
jgi:hypothetical protein